MTTKTDRPDWGERLCYTAGGLGIRFAFGTIIGYFLIYLTNVVLLDVAACSVIIAVSKFFDGISDIMVGNIIDNTDSRLGKARTWLLRMCLPSAVSLMLLFWVPSGLPLLLKYVYVFLTYNLANTVMQTFMQLSHSSMVSLISGDRKEQAVLSSLQVVTRSLGGSLGSIIFVRLLSAFTDEPGNQNTQTAYTRSMIVACIVMLVFTLISVIGTRERVRTESMPEKHGFIKESAAAFIRMLKNRYWGTLIACNLLTQLMLGLVSSGVTYYTLYILEDMNYVGPILMANLIPTVLMMFVMPSLTERFGRRKVFGAGLVISIIGLTGFGLCAPSITPMLMFYVLFGVGNGLHKGTLVVMIADMVVYTEKTTGQFKAGTGNAGLSASEKLGGGLSSIVFGSLLGAAGFNAALKVQPAAVGSMISMLFIWLPVLLLAVAFVIFILFFDFERKTDNENGHSSAG